MSVINCTSAQSFPHRTRLSYKLSLCYSESYHLSDMKNCLYENRVFSTIIWCWLTSHVSTRRRRSLLIDCPPNTWRETSGRQRTAQSSSGRLGLTSALRPERGCSTCQPSLPACHTGAMAGPWATATPIATECRPWSFQWDESLSSFYVLFSFFLEDDWRSCIAPGVPNSWSASSTRSNDIVSFSGWLNPAFAAVAPPH